MVLPSYLQVPDPDTSSLFSRLRTVSSRKDALLCIETSLLREMTDNASVTPGSYDVGLIQGTAGIAGTHTTKTNDANQRLARHSCFPSATAAEGYNNNMT